MAKYKPRPGVIKEKICGSYLLIPDRKASQYCKRVRQLGLLGSVTWNFVAENRSFDDLYKVYRILTKETDDKIKEKIDHFLEQLAEEGFLIEIEEDSK